MGKSVKFPVPKFSMACAAVGIILYVVLLIFQGGNGCPYLLCSGRPTEKGNSCMR